MVRVGIVGSGGFAIEHIEAFRAIEGVEVVGVVGSDSRRTHQLAGMAGGAKAFNTVDAMLEGISLDAVDVVNRTEGHAAASVAALVAGYPVLVDKPAALNLDQLDMMINAAGGDSARLMVGQTVRFHPAIQMLHKAIVAGDIGDPRMVHLSWYVGYTWRGGWNSWQMDPKRSGGHVVHNGVHIIDAGSWLLGEAPTILTATPGHTWTTEMPTPDSFQLTGKTPSGKLLTLQWSYGLRQFGRMERRCLVLGTSGTLQHDTANENMALLVDGYAAAPAVAGALEAELRHWVALLRGDAEPVVLLDQVRPVLAAAIAARSALESQRVIRVSQEGNLE